MALVASLLTAIVRADGDALVMHVGEKPYVVASAGPIDLSNHPLNLHAMAGMVAQLLPGDAQRALSEFGAVEHELPSTPESQGDRFTVVVARGGDDVWIEIRRHRRVRSAPAESVVLVTAPDVNVSAETSTPPSPAAASTPLPASSPEAGLDVEVAAATPPPPFEPEPVSSPAPTEVSEPTPFIAAAVEVQREPEHAPAPAFVEQTAVDPSFAEPAPEPVTAPAAAWTNAPVAGATAAAAEEPPMAVAPSSASTSAASTPAAVIPMTRTLRIEVPPPSRHPAGPSEIERLLGIAAARRATALYLTTHASPFLRVEDDVRALEGERPLTAMDVESAVLELLPEASRESFRGGNSTEWVSELADIGRVRCSTFRDYRGPGAIFQLISVRPTSAEHLGIPREIQALATDTDGLLLVASPRGHGKTTLVGSLVDLVNRQRSTYIITLEREIRLVHEHHHALISQREVRGTADQLLTLAQGALRENPDVLVMEDVQSADMFQLALEAADAGLLVIASVSAASTTAALTRAVEWFPPDQRKGVQPLIAERLRGAIAQVLLRKAGGGRVAAREVLLTTAGVASVLAEGQLHDLPLAIERGRKHGLISLNESLMQLVRAGTIDVREAYRKSDDRESLLAALKRDNVDTSLFEP